MPAHELYIGLMSGTSLDGVDAVLADFAVAPPTVLGHAHHDFAAELREELLRLCASGDDELHRAAVVAQHLARAYASAVEDLLLHADVEPGDVRAAGVHGQTVRHRPDAGYTIQLNAPAELAELVGIDIVADFRSRDLAAGGQGAPLVPAFHAAAFTTDTPRAVLNIGGICNLTGLPGRDSDTPVVGFDCGPGNILLDAWAQRHLGVPMDRDGRWAARGNEDATLVARLLEDPYFDLAPPKSTGREVFNLDWLGRGLEGREIDPKDVQASLTRLTAAVAGTAIKRHYPAAADVLVCGGGARNSTLMAMLTDCCGGRPVRSTAASGVEPEHVEALAFAWLARAHVLRTAGNLPGVTGARGGRTLGALYPAG